MLIEYRLIYKSACDYRLIFDRPAAFAERRTELCVAGLKLTDKLSLSHLADIGHRHATGKNG